MAGSTRNKNFILRIPNDLLFEITNPTKRGVFLTVYSYTNNAQGQCFASQRAIAKRSGYARQTVQRMLDELVQDGLLKVAGSQPVRGGYVTEYRISGSWSATKDTKVADGGQKVADTVTHKQLKETAAIASRIPVKEKPADVRPEVWDQACLSYQESIDRYAAKGEKVRSPKYLFQKILKDTARRLNDHSYLASNISKQELLDQVEQVGKQAIDEAYYQEAQKRGLV